MHRLVRRRPDLTAVSHRAGTLPGMPPTAVADPELTELRTEADVVAAYEGATVTVDELYAACEAAGITARDRGHDPIDGHGGDTRWRRRVRNALTHRRRTGTATRVAPGTWALAGTRDAPLGAFLLVDPWTPGPIEAHLADAAALLERVGDEGRVDLVFADPPWGLDRQTRQNPDRDRGERVYGRAAETVERGYVDVDPGAYRDFTTRWIAAAAGALDRGAYLAVTCGPTIAHVIGTAIDDAGLSILNQVVIRRPFAVPTTRRWSHSHTVMVVATAGDPDRNGRHFTPPPDQRAASGRPYPLDWWDLGRYDRRGRYRYDNALDPAVVDRAVVALTRGPESGADPWSSLVVDPFCGSGTTAAVCGRRQRRCITGDVNPAALRYLIARLATEDRPRL